MLSVLDIFLNIVHVIIVAFCVTGWIEQRWRKVHLVVLAVILFSWVVLGIWKGWGYCMLTDIQWHIKHRLGQQNLPDSFIKYMVDKVAGKDIPSSLINPVVLCVFFSSIGGALYFRLIKKTPKKMPPKKQ